MPTDWDAHLLSVDALPGFEPTIGRWVWQLEDTRRDTKQTLTTLTQTVIDWNVAPNCNTIGTLLYHIAFIELDWLFVEVLEHEPLPQEFKALFPLPARNDQGHLSEVSGVSLQEHLQRLDRVRERLLDVFRSMDIEDFRRLRSMPDYQVSPEWVLHHLIQHETEHRGHIQIVCSLAENAR